MGSIVATLQRNVCFVTGSHYRYIFSNLWWTLRLINAIIRADVHAIYFIYPIHSALNLRYLAGDKSILF